MITWFQRVFGKHFKWVLMSVLIVLLLSFIVGIGAVPRGGVSARRRAPLMVFGVNMHDDAQMRPIIQAADYSIQLTGRTDYTPQDREVFILARMAMQQLANEWGLPPPSQKQFDDYLRSLPRFTTPDGTFDNDAYARFRDEVDAAPPAQRTTTLGVLSENARLDQVRHILGGPGYTPDYIAEAQLILGQAKYDLEVATADYTKYEPKIDPTPAALEAFYRQYAQEFKVRATARLSYVLFPAPRVPDPTPEQLHDYVTAHQKEFPNVAADNLGNQAEAVTKAWRDAQKQDALKSAQAAAMKFARDLYSLNVERTAPEVAALLKQNKFTLQPLPTITRGKPAPADSPIRDEILQQVAFGMNPQTYFTSPVQLDNGAAVFIYEASTPEHDPTSFAEVRDDVLAAYTQVEKERQFTAHGAEIHDAITKAMSAGKTFAEAAAAQGLTVQDYPAATYDGLRDATLEAFNSKFTTSTDAAKTTTAGSLASMNPEMLKMFIQPTKTRIPFLYTLRPGEVTQMVPIPGEGVYIHVLKRDMPQAVADSAELQKMITQLGQQESIANAGFAVGELVKPAQEALKQDAAAQ